MFYTASRTYTSRRDKGLSRNSFDGLSTTTTVFLIIKQHRGNCSSSSSSHTVAEEEIFSSNLYSTSSKLVTNRVPARKIILCTHTRTSHRHRQLVRVYKLRECRRDAFCCKFHLYPSPMSGDKRTRHTHTHIRTVRFKNKSHEWSCAKRE